MRVFPDSYSESSESAFVDRLLLLLVLGSEFVLVFIPSSSIGCRAFFDSLVDWFYLFIARVYIFLA